MSPAPAGRSIEIEVREEDIRESLIARRSLGREVFRDPLGGFLITVTVALVANGGHFSAVILTSGLAVMLALAGFYYWRREPRFDAEVAREVRYRRNVEESRGPLHVIVAREGLAMSRGGKITQLPWSARKVRRELAHVFVVNDELLPKRQFTPAEIRLLRSGLAPVRSASRAAAQ